MSTVNKTLIVTDYVGKDLIDFDKSIFYESLANIYPKSDDLVRFILFSKLLCQCWL